MTRVTHTGGYARRPRNLFDPREVWLMTSLVVPSARRGSPLFVRSYRKSTRVIDGRDAWREPSVLEMRDRDPPKTCGPADRSSPELHADMTSQPEHRSPNAEALRVDRRQLLKLGGAALAAAALPGCATSARGPRGDLAREGWTNHQESLTRLSRHVARADGTEVAESGTGVLASASDGLGAARGSRPGVPDFDVLIVGSGYGGAVCAARLAAERRPGVRIALLERGREWRPGMFPEQLTSFNPFNPFSLFTRQHSWLGEQLSHNPLGLYGFYDHGDVVAVAGSGLGGTSLINCAVAIEAEESVFGQAEWPAPLREPGVLKPYFRRARRMLDVQPTPEGRYPAKLRTHLATA